MTSAPLRVVSACALALSLWPAEAWGRMAVVRVGLRVPATAVPSAAGSLRVGAGSGELLYGLNARGVFAAGAPLAGAAIAAPRLPVAAANRQAAERYAWGEYRAPVESQAITAGVEDAPRASVVPGLAPEPAPALRNRFAPLISPEKSPGVRSTGLRSSLARLAGLGGRSELASKLQPVFDGGRRFALDGGAAPHMRSNAFPDGAQYGAASASPGWSRGVVRRNGLSSAEGSSSEKTEAPVPSPEKAPAPARGRWVRALAYGALAAGLAAAVWSFAGPVSGFAESFGEGIGLASELSLGSLGIAFAAGLLSFLSPCTLPLIPAYLSYASGVSLEDLKNGRGSSPRRAAVGSLVFVAGFGVVFTALGATATAMGALLVDAMPIIAKGAGLAVAVMGLHTMGLLRIGLLYREKRMDVGALRSRPGLLTAFLMGMAFAFGWTPCIGPILAAILGMAATGETLWQGMALLAAYSLGLGAPFVLTALGVNRFLGFFSRYKKYLGVGERVTGAMLVIVGILIFFGGLQKIAEFF